MNIVTLVECARPKWPIANAEYVCDFVPPSNVGVNTPPHPRQIGIA